MKKHGLSACIKFGMLRINFRDGHLAAPLDQLTIESPELAGLYVLFGYRSLPAAARRDGERLVEFSEPLRISSYSTRLNSRSGSAA